ncbi:unnamed protein product [Schistosoma spindalis]|nr:unnamed protein product [Schistosoma spindale]
MYCIVLFCFIFVVEHFQAAAGSPAIHVLFDRLLRDEPIPQPVVWDEVGKLNDVERGITDFRENEKILKSMINSITKNQQKKRKAIRNYIKCKSKQQQQESYNLFLKEMNKQFKNENLKSFPDYSTLKDCFIKQENVLERKKSNEKNKVCNLLETFPEADIQVLNQLISRKYDILWKWNKALCKYRGRIVDAHC